MLYLFALQLALNYFSIYLVFFMVLLNSVKSIDSVVNGLEVVRR